MEVLHDGQKLRYSKFITRVLTPGRYYLAVLGNHPFYQLRSTLYPVPPYQDPRQAVETAMHYILGIGDAWFAQVPRLGARYRRSVMMHDEAVRCTACHPTVFPLESNLTAFQQGYPIRAKSQFQYLINRVYNAPTPLYGNPGVNWVRFVAILLQYFGKQGGLVMDYENSALARPTPLLGRFTGFLQAAWDHRETLPPDENNGVSPIDSKFGFAWRDWRVLSETARRNQDPLLKVSADHIETILASPDSLNRLEGTQDRLHRLHALALMNPSRYSGEIGAAIQYFLDRQNPDGGWPGDDEKSAEGKKPIQSRESVEYLTGQTIHTLLLAGAGEKERARLERGGRFLLSRQQEFGGWFQTETVENFVTPLRETRYSIMALATLYPQGAGVGQGLGNRDGKPARLPRTDSVEHTLDDLDNLWQVPDPQRAEFVVRISNLLGHENSWVRALAAQCLGRIGDQAAVPALLARLEDPEKMVWQSAAWALRQLGNRGLGVEALRAALSSSEAAARRGAARVFAYQFYGMDEHSELLDAFFPLLTDPDLLTRHQAVGTLAQWWYRTPDRAVRRRIFQALLDRLADAGEDPLQRSNLSQALYNLMDENLGTPGTGYSRWVHYLEPQQQEALRSERRWQEQEILLKPVLRALGEGPPQQRLGVLLAFDGTPFSRGYTTASFGPGNDREFGFERGRDFDGLGTTFASLLSRQDRAEELGYGLRLGAFFDVFRGENARHLVPLYLNTLLHPKAGVREAAMDIADKVSLQGIEEEEWVKLVQASSGPLPGRPETHGTPEGQTAVLKLLRSQPDLLQRPPLAQVAREAAEDPKNTSLALPLLASPAFSAEEAESALVKAWPASLSQGDQESKSYRELRERNSLLSQQALEQIRRSEAAPPPQAFLDCLDLLEKRPGLLDQVLVRQRLSEAARSGSGKVRQSVFELLARHPEEGNREWTAPLVGDALLDSRAEVRRAALNLAKGNSGVWQRPKVHEAFLRLLVDPDAQVRKAALDLVGEKGLITLEPGLSGRVKALEVGEGDPTVRQHAAEVLRQAGLDPARVRPTGDLSKPALPDFDTFRRTISSYFYKESARDGRSCANCHATHRIFRLAEPPATGRPLSEEALQQNYRSLLKVVDVYDPENSLVLRKPRSPSGQGNEDANSPTGLTHVGGPRWSSTDDPAYQAILQWIRAATDQKIAVSPERE
jgi:cellulose synthase operon protein C